MPADFAQIERIFSEALDKEDSAECTAYLNEACQADVELRERVEALLAAHADADNILRLHDDEATVSFVPVSERPGNTIGRYKLLEQIGEGGFGVVFMAEQEQPVRRRVALKIIKAGMDTKQVVARFEAERQALAMMDHPNIAKVLDAGATDTGRPFFVMELVRGVPITEYCDETRLNTEQRLVLFQTVCSAVQHAHQKGVIHRDLKPSNVMVTMHDDKAVPKVIDFGVAKATQGRLTERTLFTEFRQIIGTPTYMSPEQAHFSGLDVDTRSDVYSLGVLLYELLTGTTPIDSTRISSATYDDLRRMICEEDPPSPSARLSTLSAEERTQMAHRRNCDPAGLAMSLRSDLDWIVMCCLEKDRSRRYETANALSRDIERYLGNDPVEARAPTSAYRFNKFIRRNKVGVFAGSAVILALLVGFALAVVGVVHARSQAAIANAQALRSDQVAQFLKEMLAATGPGVAQGRDTTLLREVVDKTALRVENDLQGQPALQADLLETLGIVYRDLGLYSQAESALSRSLKLRIDVYGESNALVADATQHLGDTYWQQRNNSDAEKAFRRALAIRRSLFGEENADVAASLYGLAETLRRKESRSALEEAESVHREALAIRRRVLGNDHPDVARSLTGLGITLGKNGSAEYDACLREAMDIQSHVLGSEHPDVAYTLSNLGVLKVVDGSYAEAEVDLREALRIQQKVLGKHRDTAYTWNFLGSALRWQSKYSEAEQAHRSALAIQKEVLGVHTDVGVTLNYLGDALRCQERLEESGVAFSEALTLRRKLLGEEHPSTLASLLELINVRLSQENSTAAETLTREYLDSLETKCPEDWITFDVRTVLGGILLKQGKFGEAEVLLLSGYEGMKKSEQSIPKAFLPHLQNAIERVIELCQETGRLDQAEQWRAKLVVDSP